MWHGRATTPQRIRIPPAYESVVASHAASRHLEVAEVRRQVRAAYSAIAPDVTGTDRWAAAVATAAPAPLDVLPTEAAGLPVPAPTRDYSGLWTMAKTGPGPDDFKWAALRSEFENQLLAERKFLVFRDSRELLSYDPGRGFYVPDGDTFIAEWIRTRFADKKTESGRDVTATSKFVAEVTATVRDRSYKDRSSVNLPWSLVLSNGVFDLKTHALRPHSPVPAYTFGLPVSWIPSAAAPQFTSFLERCLPDRVVREVTIEVAAYALWPTAELRKAAFLFGPTTTGKSTFLAVLRGVLGTENTASVDLAELVDNRFRAAELFARLANIRSDLPAKLVRNVGLFQELTGGQDTITGERKHQHPFSFKPTAKLFFSANRLPRIPGVTPAFWKRWALLPFEVRVQEDLDQPDFAQVLLQERDGIFRLLVEASDRLRAMGRFPELPIEVRDRWLRNSDPALYVVGTLLVDQDGGCVDLNALLDRIGELCEEEGVAELPDAREVGAAMRRCHPRVRVERSGPRNDRRTTYWGVAWAEMPPAVAAPVPTGEKRPAGATGGLATNRRENLESYNPEGIAGGAVAPGTPSLSEKPRPATVQGSAPGGTV